MARHIKAVETETQESQANLSALGDLRPATLSHGYNVCGNPRCRCKDSPPQKHGPCHQISYTRKGKSGTRFVKRQELSRIKRALKNYQRLPELLDKGIDPVTELSDLRLAELRKEHGTSGPTARELPTLQYSQ